MIDLRNRKILFFSPKAFGYEKGIKTRLEELGAVVDYFDDRPSNDFWGKALLRVKRNLVQVQIERYYHGLYELLVERICDYDDVFLLNLEAMPIWFLDQIRGKKKASANIILYMWDSFRNKPHAKDYIPYCDRIITFNPADQKENARIEFRPLFYLNEYAQIAQRNNITYVLSFIGTAHSDRFGIARKVKNQVEASGLRTYFYFFLQSRKLFFYQKLTNKYFKGTKISDFMYRALSSEEVMEVVASSKAVLDIQHPKQTGLTMRTIEMLGAKRKLITTNPAVKEYDFYNPQNILVIDRANPIVNKEFLESLYSPINEKLYYKYSLDGWIEYIFKE